MENSKNLESTSSSDLESSQTQKCLKRPGFCTFSKLCEFSSSGQTRNYQMIQHFLLPQANTVHWACIVLNWSSDNKFEREKWTVYSLTWTSWKFGQGQKLHKCVPENWVEVNLDLRQRVALATIKNLFTGNFFILFSCFYLYPYLGTRR